MLSLEEIKKYTEKNFARSSGPGGQNVNKASTKVFLIFDIQKSSLSPYEKERLMKKFLSGFIQVMSQETRSQSRNIALAFLHLQHIISDALKIRKARKKILPAHLTKTGKVKKMRHEKLIKYKRRRDCSKSARCKAKVKSTKQMAFLNSL